MKFYTINFEPLGKKGKCKADETVLDCAHRLGVAIISLCGGLGKLNCCKIQILKGKVSKPTTNELNYFSAKELDDGYRLACQTYLKSNCNIKVPLESLELSQRVEVEGAETRFELKSPIISYDVKLSSPSLSDLRSDDKRLEDKLLQQHKIKCRNIDIDILRKISPLLRSWGWEAQVSLRNDEIIGVNNKKSNKLGLAIDLGTTTIAGYLLDISRGKILASKGNINPQIKLGEDIVSRITYANKSLKNAEKLKNTALDALNQLIVDLCNESGTKSAEILDSVIVGNTVMHHLLLQLPIKQLTVSPFTPAVGQALDIKARDAGLYTAPGAYVHFLPNIAGFVGADHVSMLLATKDMWKDGSLVIALDIGTNTEISLIESCKISSLSCASGPAFEGANIKNGMRATDGAIEKIKLLNGHVEYETIGGMEPIGICGSGILDAVSELYFAGIINSGGKMKKNKKTRESDGQMEFVLVDAAKNSNSRPITITQKDIREVQLAKAAISSGINILLGKRGFSKEKIKKIIIAGAFGSYINIMSALNIGMFPKLPLSCFKQVGNAAGMGAKLALLSSGRRLEAKEIAYGAAYIELASHPNFQDIFMKKTYLG